MTDTQADLDHLLCCFLFAPQQARERAQTLTAEQWQHCLERAVSHKILPDIAAYYQQYQPLPLPARYQAILRTHTVERASWLTALRLAAPFSQRAQAMLMKGFGHEILYPEKRERFAKDLDVVVADFPAFCEIAAHLLRHGFHMPFMAQLIWRKKARCWEGLARFIHHEGNDDGGVELHIGEFVVDEHHKLRWPALRAQATDAHIDDIPLCVPDTPMMLTVFFMELATRPECMLRDLYDGYCLGMTLTDRNQHTALAAALNREGLGDQVSKLMAAFARFHLTPPDGLVQLAEQVHHTGTPATSGWRDRLRKRLDAACQHAPGLLRVFSLLDRPWAIGVAMQFAIPIYGILIASDPQPLHLQKIGRYRLLMTPAGTFLLGGVGLFSDEEIAYLESVIASSPLPLTPEPEP